MLWLFRLVGLHELCQIPLGGFSEPLRGPFVGRVRKKNAAGGKKTAEKFGTFRKML